MQTFPHKIKESLNDLTSFTESLKKGVENLVSLDERASGFPDDHDSCGTCRTCRRCCSLKEVVFQDGKRTLYRYKQRAKKVNSVPTLMVYAMVNRYTMLDLQPNRSMIRNLLDEGQDLYIIDWGYTDRMDRFMTMEDYIDGFINDCVDHIREKHKLDSINLIGICQGGTFSTIYAALYPEKIKNFIPIVTPVDFDTKASLLNVWSTEFDADLLIDAYGNVPGDMMNQAYTMLQPFTLSISKYINMVNIMEDADKLADFLRMETWIFDSPDQPGETLRQFLKDLFQANKLVKGQFVLGKRTVDLKNITMPILNIFAEFDTLVPPVSSKALRDHVSSKDIQDLSFPVGHIGIFVSGKTQKTLAPKISEWLNARA
ncbi:MAG: class III poly(R)-hydroxyalkanoic acid synthase subunit PhaC [Desulfuromonadaceae bacterium]|nr:class III poly(R)-hydroxyalkanoic acid synthase subunit PhaC [Desulfuromonadaceae bacterium]